MCYPKSVLGKYQYQGYSKNTPTDTPPCANKGLGIREKGYSVLKIPVREKARKFQRFRKGFRV